MEWGSVADWFSAIGGLLAVIAAVISWQVSEKSLRLEQKNAEHADMREKRQQASLIMALGAKYQKSPSEPESWSIYLYNGSSQPVFDVLVKSQHLDGNQDNHDLALGVLPPRSFIVPSDPQYHWGGLTALDGDKKPVSYLVKGKGMNMIKEISFSDISGTRWRLEKNVLSELGQA